MRILARVRETRREKEISRLKSHLAWETIPVQEAPSKRRRRG